MNKGMFLNVYASKTIFQYFQGNFPYMKLYGLFVLQLKYELFLYVTLTLG